MSVLQLGTLEKANKILELYNEEGESFTFSEIVEKTGLEKGSVQRLLFTLQHLGLLSRHQRYKRYSLSTRFISFAVSYMQTDPLMSQALKYLDPLARQTDQAVGLALLDGVRVFYTHRIPNLVSNDFALLPVRRYAYCTAAGRAMMACMPDEAVDALLDQSPLRRFTANTITDKDEIRRRVHEARHKGIAWQDCEVLDKELAIAAAIIGDGGWPVGAVALSIDKDQYDIATAIDRFGDMVRAAAQEMSSPSLTASRFPYSRSA
jgi:IclR family pca regulon transcriptional regulator